MEEDSRFCKASVPPQIILKGLLSGNISQLLSGIGNYLGGKINSDMSDSTILTAQKQQISIGAAEIDN